MDTFRSVLALVHVTVAGPILLMWFLVHPFVGFWRRLGPAVTYTVVGMILVGIGVAIVHSRQALIAVDFGLQWPLLGVGALCLGVAGRLRMAVSRHFSVAMLLGLPELAPERYASRLVTEGLYARIRHPRYVEILIGLLGYALIANHLAPYVVCAMWLVGIPGIVRLEERELRARFGAAYEDYSRQVPRFVPRLALRHGPRGEPRPDLPGEPRKDPRRGPRGGSAPAA